MDQKQLDEIMQMYMQGQSQGLMHPQIQTNMNNAGGGRHGLAAMMMDQFSKPNGFANSEFQSTDYGDSYKARTAESPMQTFDRDGRFADNFLDNVSVDMEDSLFYKKLDEYKQMYKGFEDRFERGDDYIDGRTISGSKALEYMIDLNTRRMRGK